MNLVVPRHPRTESARACSTLLRPRQTGDVLPINGARYTAKNLIERIPHGRRFFDEKVKVYRRANCGGPAPA